MNQIIAGVDFGNAATKMASGDGSVEIFPSVIGAGTIHDGKISRALGMDHNVQIPDVVQFNGTTLMVGSGVAHHTRRPVQYLSEGRYIGTDTMLRPLLYAAIARGAPNRRWRNMQAMLIIGVPIGLYARWEEVREAMEAWLPGTHEFSVNGESYVLNVNDFGLLPQPFGSLLVLGQSKGRTAIIDIGHGDAQVLVFNNTGSEPHIDENRTASAPIGAHAVYNQLRAMASDGLSENDAAAIIGGKMTHLPSGAPVGNMARQAIDAVAPSLISWVRERLDGEAMRYVATGGGALMFRSHLSHAFRDVNFIQGAQTANARGFYRAATAKWG